MMSAPVVLQEPYAVRPIRFVELWQPGDWRVKVYGISYGRELPRAELVRAAKEAALRQLEKASGGHYGIGFLGVHDGRGANWVFVDWWADENELHQHVYISPSDAPAALEEVTAQGLCACVWDLKVVCHERQAWVDHVLVNAQGPDVEGYLATRLNVNA